MRNPSITGITTMLMAIPGMANRGMATLPMVTMGMTRRLLQEKRLLGPNIKPPTVAAGS
jgi:hypothetical protein